MEGIGLDNMLSADEVNKLFGSSAETSPEETGEEAETNDESQESQESKENEETAEVDFSDLLGNQSESVGSEENTEGHGEAPKSEKGQGTPQQNLFSSIAEALRDEGVFPDLSDDILKNVKDAETLKKAIDAEVSNMLDERQRRIESALNSGADTDEVKAYQQAISINQFLENRNTVDNLSKEGEEGETLRKQVMYQDYINRGFTHDKAVKMVQRSLDDGTDIEDAKEAFESCKAFYKEKIDSFQQEMENRKKQAKATEEKQYANLKKRMLENETFYNGVKVEKNIRQKAYDSITKPVFKDEQGNLLTELQKYQKENPIEFMENVAMLYAMTEGFKSIDKMTKKKVNEGMKKGFANLESVLNSSRRNGDGTLNLANSGPDDSERDKWTLAM